MVLRDISLRRFNTFGLDYQAEQFVSVSSESEAIHIIQAVLSRKSPYLILGGGSNVLFTGNYKGMIVHPEIGGISIEEKKTDYNLISAGGGVKWDSLVEWTVDNGLGGLENLSYIPGSVGASPIQNIGAYGVEVKDTIEKVRAISFEDGSIREFDNSECRFGYRNSIFKQELKGKYLVSRVYFKLATRPKLNLLYGSLVDETNYLGGATLKNVRTAIIKIRKNKLPEPEIIGNAGSFFKNPVVDIPAAEMLRKRYPGIPCYDDQSGGIKLAAGWLIDKCGWKGKRAGNTGVHDKQALIIVNYGGATGQEILNLAEEIKKSVWYKFEVELEREVEVIGTI